MAHEVIMPMLGMTMVEGKLIKWLKQEGDAVKRGDEMFELETEKFTNTVEAVGDGVLLKITSIEGDVYPCFAQLGIVGDIGEDISELLAKAGAVNSEVAETLSGEVPLQSVSTPSAQVATKNAGGRIFASPAARKLMRETGVDITLVVPTGPNGRIVLRDVENFMASAPRASGLAKKMAEDLDVNIASIPASGRVMSSDVVAFVNATTTGEQGLDERVAMNGMRKTIAQRMSESQSISPTVNYVINTDVTSLRVMKNALATDGVSVSYTDLLIKIVAKTLLEFPKLNCSVEGEEIVYKHYINMGVAVALDDGLVVPVINNSHLKGLAEISAELKELSTSAREGRLSPDAMSGGTFTISNLGMFGIESFTPIINQPEVAILGVNAITDTIVPIDGTPTVRPMMKLSLTADHRAADGAVAAAFLAKLKKVIENPALLLT